MDGMNMTLLAFFACLRSFVYDKYTHINTKRPVHTHTTTAIPQSCQIHVKPLP